MLKANATDSKKLEAVTVSILATAANKHAELQQAVEGRALPLRFVSVDPRQFYAQCRFARLRKHDFAAEVQDLLTRTSFVNEYGTWLYTEYDFKRWFFIYVGGQSDCNVLNTLADSGEMVEIVVPDVVAQPSEDRGIWYITSSGAIAKLSEKSRHTLSSDGSSVTLNLLSGSYTTKTYASKAMAESSLIALNGYEDGDENDDAQGG